VAWYSDQLRPFLGPENFNNLPGAVLNVDINEGEKTITAKSIVFRPLAKGEMNIPHARTQLTEAEYKKMVKEQIERMRDNGGNIRLRH
jgi:GLPGLI family protein